MNINELLKLNNIHTMRIPNISKLLHEPKVLLNRKVNNQELSEQIFDLLMDSTIRRGDGLIFENAKDAYKSKISRLVQKDEPIHLVFQGLPFKCHNPVETLRSTPDLGELATLQRLSDINETVKQIYKNGVRFTILTEGNNYLNLFGATKMEADIYQKRCIEFSKIIKADNLIEFIDFMDLVEDKNKFFNQAKHAEKEVMEAEIKQFIPVMMRSMPITESIPFDDLFAIFGHDNEKSNLTEFQADFKDYIKEGAIDLSIKYLGIQKVKKQLNLINNNFPESLYVSTTSKNDKYSFHPIHKKTRLYAHHGVPVLGSDKVDIIYLSEVVSSPEIYTGVYLEDDIEDAPFYFLKGKQYIKKQV